MLNDILNTFRKMKETQSENFILDNYVFNSIGEFLIIKETETGFDILDNFEQTKSQPIEKTRENYGFIKSADFYSNIISMNKFVGCKQVLSCNCYSFFMKQKYLAECESVKNVEKTVDNYYRGIMKLAALPEKLNKKGKERKLNIEDELSEIANIKAGEIDCEFLEKIKTWMKQNLPKFREKYLPNKYKDMDIRYLKIYVLREIDDYKRENARYIDQKIFAKTEDCIRDNAGIIRGFHGYSSSFGDDKIYSKPTSRKSSAPCLYTAEQLMEFKDMFDYIIHFTNENKRIIYVTDDSIVGYKIGELPNEDLHGLLLVTSLNMKALEILDCSYATDFHPKLSKSFLYNNLLEAYIGKKDFEYGYIDTIQRFEDLINIVLFKGFLKSNYLSDKVDVMNNSELSYNIQIAKDSLFTYFYKNKNFDIFPILETVTNNLILNSIINKDINWTRKLLNLRFSLISYFKGEKEMNNFLEIKENLRKELNRTDNEEMKDLKTDDEYAIAIGQLAYYLISLSVSKERQAEGINNICSSKNSLRIKDTLYDLHVKYASKIGKYNPKFERLMSLVMCYNDDAKINRGLILGSYYSPNILYEKKLTDIPGETEKTEIEIISKNNIENTEDK